MSLCPLRITALLVLVDGLVSLCACAREAIDVRLRYCALDDDDADF
jgi:hypothetical protein